jgi:hypothetical protein
MSDSSALNQHIQEKLRGRTLDEVDAVTAARWLDEARLLADSPHRPGKNLRYRLRRGAIAWFIRRLP